MSSTWDSLSIFKINQENKKLDLIITIHVNNGSINHMYEYKKNKILCCDNQMKIVQLNEENDQYKILYISDYSRKIIPYIPYNINQNSSTTISPSSHAVILRTSKFQFWKPWL